MITTVEKLGDSIWIPFNSEVMELARLKTGDEVNVEVQAGGTITITPLRPNPSTEEASQTSA
jgi:antitoxin component of MazEF toxin-antitoxin module